MSDYFIYTADSLIRASFERLLLQFGFDAVCLVGGVVPDGFAHKNCLWIGGDAPADVPDGQIFGYPVRVGRVLDCLLVLIARQQDDVEISVGRYVLKASRNVLSAEGAADIKVTDTEKRLLLALFDAGADGLPRDLLLERVWGMRADLDTHTVETHIYRLRQKIEVDKAKPVVLLTKGDGYVLVC